MEEFIEELRHNQNINFEKDLENRINIDYVIERLENVQKDLLRDIEYFDYHNKNLTREQEDRLQNIKDNLTDKGVFK